MTNLTELYQKGKLPKGYYYLKKPDGKVMIITPSLRFMVDGYSILAEVPSFEQWQDLKSKLQLKETAYDFDTARLEEENTKLKKLLKGNKSLNEAVISTFDWLKTIITPSQRDMCQKVVTLTTELNEKIDEFLGEE